jgi:hypothetical protein
MIVPDLVLIIRPTNDQLLKENGRALSQFNCAIMAYLLNNGPRFVDEIAESLFARPSIVERATKELSRRGLIAMDRGGGIKLPRTLLAGVGQVIAVEAKLDRWREAMAQAVAYLGFANESYVALPDAIIERRTKLTKECRANGIGLISVNPTSCKIVVRARKHKPRTSDWLWLLGKTVGFASK